MHLNFKDLFRKAVPQKDRPTDRKVEAPGLPPSPTRASSQIRSLVSQYCVGKGLEIGPGKQPYCDRANTIFLDKHTQNRDGMPDPDIVSDASSVPVPDDHFDFLLSSHCLEHCPNTLKTLYEWKRVIKPGGILFLVLPHAERTFDRHRQLTTLEHHIRDFETVTGEHDDSHFTEMKEGWLKCEDIEELRKQYERDWGAPIWDFDFRMKHNVLHYHVWTQDETVDVIKYIRLKILYVVDVVAERNDSFLVIAKK